MKTAIYSVMTLLIFSITCYNNKSVGFPSVAPVSAGLGWQEHTVRQFNGQADPIQLPARFQIISTENWNEVVTIPYIIYMPEKDRLLILANCDYPHRPFVMTSDDHGAHWTDLRPVTVDKDGNPASALGLGLAYLGDGNALLYSGRYRWFSRDYGKTWSDTVAIAQTSDEKYWAMWCSPLVERDHKTRKVIRIAETGYAWFKPPEVTHAHQQGYIRFSTDEGKTWGKSIKVPEWERVSEVALLRADNGDLLGACRTDIPHWMEVKGLVFSPSLNDGYEGLGVSVSKDDGLTWSTVRKLYDYGRHHPSLLMLPNQNIVMTYVVRAGYVDDKNGFPQFGIEAVISHDNGKTWDLDHRYVLHTWVGNRKGKRDHYASPYCASLSLLPDGSIITVFGTGYRSQFGLKKKNHFAPRDLGLVRWQLNPEPVNNDRTIRNAAADSRLRNIFDPSPEEQNKSPQAKIRK